MSALYLTVCGNVVVIMIGEFGYRVPVFENGKKPKGGPLEIEKFPPPPVTPQV